MDIRKCHSSCPSQQISSLHLSVPGLSRQSSMLDFLRSRKVRAPYSCPRGWCCEPAQLHLERLLLLEGLREVEVVKGCHCSACPEECLQLPALKTFFPDSPWEVTMDMGKCSHPTYSADGLSCVPTKFSTVLVKKLHGEEVVQILENCKIKEKCYGVSQMEYYYEIVRALQDTGKNSSRESQDGEECLVWAPAAPRRCAPHGYDMHRFRSRRDQARTVAAIRECKCRG